MAMMPMQQEVSKEYELTQSDGGTYINTTYLKKVFVTNGVKQISIIFDLKAITGGTGGWVKLFDFPSGNSEILPKATMSNMTVTLKGSPVQIAVRTTNYPNSIVLTTNSTISAGELVALTMVYV